ncbi:MAG: Riboflavin synthase alpha chain [Hydrocarboniphaga sp.]|uniref:riboflavin synthase n=1 Tax=Hydrocarboniphaga sp. TaxID=2033016 RepID=UPI002626D550|nr:riboflavin synthase [Hydrocarboniphaga sp.]MDB5968598.1 Riboflavin synthase alpha chain [Hydrocarboniphaga sp.]
MFTGIVESVGRITAIEFIGGDRRMRFESSDGYLQGIALGDSIACNGCCLTAVKLYDQGFDADLSGETLGATTAGAWQQNQAINLEKALTAHKPLGGHMVSGHVDGLGRLIERREDARSWRMLFEVPAELARYIARKGSITIDGVSLTVNEVEGRRFGVNIIPQTLTHTTLGNLQTGDAVNLEVDLIARYLERLLAARGEEQSTPAARAGEE